MRRSLLAFAGIATSLATIAAVRFGGWATVSVQTVPDYFVVGKPTELTFTVRQHAVSPLTDLSPEVVATSGRREVAAKARNVGSGRYRVDLTVPETGDWRVVINSGFGRSRGELLPIRALAASPATAIAMTDADRGRVLFAGKACVTCHVHSGVDIKGEASDAGPDLTDKRFAPQYLAQFLNDPSIKPASDSRKGQMPRPDLRAADIPLLVAFINAERKTASK
jgi:mono/diheme cytochrome c family protein